jgi:acyl transferase domain-containing protein/acyl carrier protein
MTETAGTGTETGLEIAVIGLAARFPGAPDIARFWDNLENGRESITFFSREELAGSGVDAELLENPRYIGAKGVLEDADCFDAAFFGYSPGEAELMDPQVRIFHECVWTALEDAGYNPDPAAGKHPIGCYAGATNVAFWEAFSVLSGKTGAFGDFQAEQFTNKDYLSTRIAYRFNFRGPALTVQTACSTSLVAVHLACQGLLGGECDMAVAGGVTVNQPANTGYLYQEGMVRSSDGHCRAFAAASDGTVFGDGAGVVILKRLHDALADRDHIYAVIKGSAINNDGLDKAGYTAPAIDGQAAVIRSALQMAEVQPETIGYVETHGTGTSLGDPIEIEGLKMAFNTAKKGFCRIGSVKTNIGHLDTAAGIAGFIKTVLILKNRRIPASLNFQHPNPAIDFDSSPFTVNISSRPWQSNGGSPLRAAVSSFGIGGTNAHVVLEEAPVRQKPGESQQSQCRLFLISARSKAALERSARQLGEFFRAHPHISPADAAYTLQTGRGYFEHRRMVLCNGLDEAADAFSKNDGSGGHTFYSRQTNVPVVFMFPGQGSQYVDMSLGLYRHEPRFRRVMDRCFDILTPLYGFDLKGVLFTGSDTSAVPLSRQPGEVVTDTEFAQPLLFAVEYALATLLMDWGIVPQAMTGHSIGEYTAACMAGVFSMEEALQLVSARGKAIQQAEKGAMTGVSMPEEEVHSLLEGRHELSLAAVNGPEQCVVSGTFAAIEALEKALAEQGTRFRRLHTSHAFHSAMLEPVLEDFTKKARNVNFKAPQIPYISNLSGNWISAAEAMNPDYWVRHVRETVRFGEGIGKLLQQEHALFLEVGPGRTLGSLVQQHSTVTANHRVLNLVRHPREDLDDYRYLLGRLGEMWLYGKAPDWSAFYTNQVRCRIHMPGYPFERQPFPGYSGNGAGLLQQELSRHSRAAETNRQELDDWFYTPSWKRTPLPVIHPSIPRPAQHWLVFMDSPADTGSDAVDLLLVERLCNSGHDVTIVHRGNTFKQLENSRFRMRAGCEDDYHRLLEQLKQQDRLPEKVLHFWTLDNGGNGRKHLERVDLDLENGFYSLLFLAKALGTHMPGQALDLQVVSSNMQEATGDDLHFPVKAALLGPVMVIPVEYPSITCKSIDVVLPLQGSLQQDRLLDQLTAELTAESPDPVLAFRGNHRLVRDFEPVKIENTSTIPARMKNGGVYLVTGGLGGIGLTIARCLARCKEGIKLVLTGRTPVPMTIEGAEVEVIAADTADIRQMSRVMETVAQRFGTIDGVIHAAGVPGGGLIQRKSAESAQAVLLPKVQGTLVLDTVLEGFSPDFFVLCSSINSVCPQVGQADYFAANAVLDAYAHHKRARSGIHVVSIDWDTWQEVGMAVDAASEPTGHPLLSRRLIQPGSRTNEEIYFTTFDLKEFWVLNEHKAGASGLAPGTAYLEMVRAAMALKAGNTPVSIRSVYFLNPMLVEENRQREVRLRLQPEAGETGFTIESRDRRDRQNRWLKHAAGTVILLDTQAPVHYDIARVITRCPQQKSSLSVDDGSRAGNGDRVVFGPRWNSLKELRYGEHEALALLDLSAAFADDFSIFHLHPALLDTATGFHSIYWGSGRGYIPFSYKRIDIKGNLPPRIYSLCRLNREPGKEKDQQESLTFDITIMDEQGTELLDIEAFTMLSLDGGHMQGKRTADTADRAGLDNGDDTADRQVWLQNAILPEEGIEVFQRLLDTDLAQVAVSTVPLDARMRRSEHSTADPDNTETEGEPVSSFRLPRPELSVPYTPPTSNIEKELAAIWEEFLGLEKVGANDDFFELGGDSLKAITVAGKIHHRTDVELSMAEFFNGPTINTLARYIDAAGKSTFQAIEAVEKREYYPLGLPQKRMYLLLEKELDTTNYNLPMTMPLPDDFGGDLERLEYCFRQLILRHESLRTSFIEVEGEPVQRVHDDVPFEIEYFASREESQRLGGEFLRPFALDRAPLLRVRVVKQGNSSYLLMLDKSHLICDGVSHDILVRDFYALFREEALPPIRIQYKDYAVWQHSSSQAELRKKQEVYWLGQFSTRAPLLELPLDFSRPPVRSIEGDNIYFSLSGEQTGRLKKAALRQDATLFMLLMAAVNLLLSKLSGIEDIVVGTVVAGRRHSDLEQPIGMFVNTLAVRNFPAGQKSLKEFIAEVKQTTLQTFENQDYPFEDLLEKVDFQRDLARNPLFDVLFSLQDADPYNYENKVAKFDLSIEGHHREGNTLFNVEYCTKLFKKESIELFIDYFKNILELMSEPNNLQKRLADIDIVAAAAQDDMMSQFSDNLEEE